MPRIAKVGKSEIYNAHTTAGMQLGERGDCAVRAIAAVTGTEYAVVHAMMAEQGRKNRRGTPWEIIWGTLDQLGYATVEVAPHEFICQYPGAHATALKSVTTHHPDRFPAVWRNGKAYIFNTPRHVAAIVDGVNHDWTRGRACRAVRIWEIVKKTPKTEAAAERAAELEVMIRYEM